MPKKIRKRPSADEKAAILRLHLLERVPVSDLCDRYDIHPTMFYRWQKELFENATAALERRPRRLSDAKDRRISLLEEKLQRKNEVLSELMEEHIKLKKRAWGTLNGLWVPQAMRDSVVQFVRHWASRTGLPAGRLLRWLELAASKFNRWSQRLGTPNRHNAAIPRDFWLEDWERIAIVAFHDCYPLEGYRRLAYMMLDANVVAVSPSSVYRVLKAAGKLAGRAGKPSKKGQGFEQPLRPHEHWHIDVSYINICGTFFYLCSILDGYSRFIVHWEIRERMTERDVETIVQRARERFPEARPRIISDNGPQFIAWEFKQFIRICGMAHVRTSPYYPQSNGKMERWFKTLKGECIRVKTPLSLEDARRLVAEFVTHYNTVRLHSAIGYITPNDKLAGREEAIWSERKKKLAAAEARRQEAHGPRQQVTQP